VEFTSMVSAELCVNGHSPRSSGCYGRTVFRTASSSEYIFHVRLCRHFTFRVSSTRQCDLILRMMCRRVVNKDGKTV
jgi:hypothetical protein